MLDIGSPQLRQVATVLNVEYTGAPVKFSGISIDSREVESGNLFFAIKGPNFDGHDYIDAAKDKGAVAAVVSKPVKSIPVLIVADTKQALASLAASWRDSTEVKLAAITGSNGKTTVKEMLASIMQNTGIGIKTRDNLNNDFGVPLTLLRLKPEHLWAVIEMGASGPGEIGVLARIAKPQVALVNNVSPAHIGGYSSIAEIAKTKGEIFKYLPEDGVAIMPYGHEFTDLWLEQSATDNIMTFGQDEPADVKVKANNGNIKIRTPKGVIELSLPLPGEHNHLNAAAATAIALGFNISLENIKAGLERVEAVQGRLMTQVHKTGARIIDDSYNANPVSVKAAIKYLAGLSGHLVFVLGDMTELGDDAKKYHQEVGALAKELQIDEFFSHGELAKAASDVFGVNARHFMSMDELINHVDNILDADTTVLVKGSRFMQMQRLTEALLEDAT